MKGLCPCLVWTIQSDRGHCHQNFGKLDKTRGLGKTLEGMEKTLGRYGKNRGGGRESWKREEKVGNFWENLGSKFYWLTPSSSRQKRTASIHIFKGALTNRT